MYPFVNHLVSSIITIHIIYATPVYFIEEKMNDLMEKR